MTISALFLFRQNTATTCAKSKQSHECYRIDLDSKFIYLRMESDRKSRTYRVSELPAGVDIHHVATLLSRFPNIGPPERIRVHSLASSLHEWDLPATKVATITFTQPPEAFADGKTEWPLEGHWAGLAHNIIVDSHFLGLTPLNEVDAQKHVIE